MNYNDVIRNFGKKCLARVILTKKKDFDFSLQSLHNYSCT